MSIADAIAATYLAAATVFTLLFIAAESKLRDPEYHVAVAGGFLWPIFVLIVIEEVMDG